MSRHRNVRSMNYSEEYEGFDDVYGHSVEDDHCISPSEARFLYDRTRHPQMSAFINEENDIAEEDELGPVNIQDTKDFNIFKPTKIDEDKLRLCMDDIQDVIGDMVPLNTIREIVLKCDYDVQKSLDHILNEKETQKNVLLGMKESSVPIDQQLATPDSSDITFSSKESASEVENQMKAKNRGVRTIEPVKCEEKPTKEPNTEPEVPSVMIVPSGVKTKGFEISESNKTNATLNYPKCPSGRASPYEPEDSTKNSEKNAPRPSAPPRESKIDAEKHYKIQRGDSKEVLHMVVIGHVDAGKSTLMGHLLYSLGQVNKKTMHKYEQESKKLGKQSFVYAWILDETGEERSRGITMDVGQSKFETNTKIINLLDAPGHKDFIPNMITGATQADVAVLVVDATRGEFETGFESGGQTREHALLVRSLGVSQLAVVINKLDTVGWCEDRFKEIQSKLGAFLKQVGYRESDVTYVPCSGLAGENLVEKSTQQLLTNWYKGPCLLEVIDNFKVPKRPINSSLRVSVSDVYKGTGSGFCVTGHVETGMAQAGDKVLVMPQNETAVIKGISIDEAPVQTAFAGDGVCITLANYDIQHISVGCILSDPSNPVPTCTHFEARIIVFNVSVPITAGYPVVLHIHSLTEQAVVVKLVAQLNKSSGEIVKKRPRCLTKNSNAIVEIETSRPICLELYRETKELGRFMLRVGGVSIAAGLVTKIL